MRDGLTTLKCLSCFKSFISPSQRHFNMLHINSTDGVGGDRPMCAWQRRVIVPSLDSEVCFPSWEMIGTDKTNL